MSTHTSPVAKRARTRGPPHRAPRLKCRYKAGGRYKDVQSVVSADSDGRLLVRFTDGTQLVDADGAPRPVAKKELVFFAPQQPPDAPRQLAGLVGAPRFFQGQQECFDHAGSNGHAFFGAFQIFRKKWGWSACQCQEKRATCEACGVGPTDYGAISGMFESVKVDGSKLTVKLKRNFNQKSTQLLDKLTRHIRKSGLPVKMLQYEEGGSPGMGGPPSLVRTIIIRGDIP